MTIDHTLQTELAIQKGIRESDRIEQDLVAIIQGILASSSSEYKGKTIEFRAFGKRGIDIKGVDGFDHIEFTITKTGFGRMA